MTDKIRVLTVDDNDVNNTLIYKALIGDYDIEVADSGVSALKILEQRDFDIVLLDVKMADMNGYQVCEQIRSQEQNQILPVLFLSAQNRLEDILKGYAAGGHDYINKPVMFDELKQKIELAVKQSVSIKALNQQAIFATETAMTAMSNNSELGTIVNFMESSFQSDDGYTLLRTLLDSLSQYQLVSCAQLRIGDEVISGCSTDVEPSNLEKTLLSNGKDAERIVTLGKRALYNSPRVSLLIRNMPIENEGKYGRFADHLATITVAADSRCAHIELQQQRLSVRNKLLDNVLEMADEEIIKVQALFNKFQGDATKMMSVLHSDIEESLFEFNLSEDQEDRLYRLLELGKREMSDLSDYGVGVEVGLTRIVTTVKTAIENMD